MLWCTYDVRLFSSRFRFAFRRAERNGLTHYEETFDSPPKDFSRFRVETAVSTVKSSRRPSKESINFAPARNKLNHRQECNKLSRWARQRRDTS